MKKMNKKGFTIVELVIVIAVIAILAAVLIPTFAGIIERANESARLQKARNAYTEYYATLDAEDFAHTFDLVIKVDGHYYIVDDNQFEDTEYDTEGEATNALKATHGAYNFGTESGNDTLEAVSTITGSSSSDLTYNGCTIYTIGTVPATPGT